MACGMVFVIVARHIDRSVGSMLAMCSAIMAMRQTTWLPSVFGTSCGNPAILAATVVIGLTSGTLMGAITGKPRLCRQPGMCRSDDGRPDRRRNPVLRGLVLIVAVWLDIVYRKRIK